MKTFVAAAVIALASVATAQFEDIPNCALSCLVTPLTSDGCPSLDDFACHCKSAESLFASVVPCVQGACSATENAAVIKAVEDTCASAGVPVQVPGESSSSSAAPSSSASSAYSTTVEVTSTATSTSTSSVSGTPSASGNGTAPTGAPTPSTSEFPGSAAKGSQAVGLLGAAALAFFAL